MVFVTIKDSDSLEKGMATHSSILAWRIPWTEETGGLQSMRLQRAGHNCASNTQTDNQKKQTNKKNLSCLRSLAKSEPQICCYLFLSLHLLKLRVVQLNKMLFGEGKGIPEN